MHDIQFIRDNPIEFDNLISKRGVKSISKVILKIDEDRRKSQTSLQKLQEERNSLSKEIGNLKSKKVNIAKQLKRIEEIKNEISTLKELENIKYDELTAILNRLPNLPAKDVPLGNDEKSNLEIKKWGKTREFNFKVKKHYEIGEDLGLMDLISPCQSVMQSVIISLFGKDDMEDYSPLMSYLELFNKLMISIFI